MKRFCILFVILFTFSYWFNVASAQNAVEIVRIPDANLAAQLRKALGLAPTALITKQALAQLTTLDAALDQKDEFDFPISDLTGLEHATQLEELRLSQHREIRDISPLVGLTQLKKLTLGSNAIRDISPLAGLMQLRELHLGGNQIRDISPLAGLTELWNLALYRNQISDISPLTDLTQLKTLYLAENQISDISPLANLTQLRDLGFLGLGDNQISDISPLSGLIQLEALDLVNNRILDVTSLAGLVNLKKLALAGNPVRDASPLAKLTKLVEVDIEIPSQVRAGGVIPDRHLAGAVRAALGLTNIEPITKQKLRGLRVLNLALNHEVSSLTGLEHAVNLEVLLFGSNKISGDISPLTNLTRLYQLSLPNSQISDISALANLKELTYLNLGWNQISDISPLANLRQLQFLWLNRNRVSDISSLTNLTRLTRLGLSGNEIRDISPLTGLMNLETLSLAWNPIGDASPLAKLPKLRDVDIEIPPRKITTDINGDGDVNIQDLVLVAANLGKTGENEADVNRDGIVDIRDLVLVASALGKVVAASALHPQLLGALSSPDIKEWLSDAKQLNLTDSTSLRGILFLQRLLTMLTPKETALLPNFPNPFNPETWIPYQLAEPADVSLSIYDVKGLLVRKLTLGHQPAGMYHSKSRAAYWDGRNKVGEPVASGVYFYTLTADDFTATRKMLILK